MMKRLRIERATGQLLAARPGCPSTPGAALRSSYKCATQVAPVRYSSSSSAVETEPVYEEDGTDHSLPPLEKLPPNTSTLPSPLPYRALESAKLSALHARLSLSPKIPLQTLARTLVDASADPNPLFNNSSLAFLGATIINYHASEWFMVHYPRLPMDVLFAAMAGLAGPAPLNRIAKSWGIEVAAAPGGEVDPGLLQFSLENPGESIAGFGYTRTVVDKINKNNWKRSVASKVIYDDDFGQLIMPRKAKESEDKAVEEDQGQGVYHEEAANPTPKFSPTSYGSSTTRELSEKAHANFARAVVGAVYTHCGRAAAKSFVKAHVLCRELDLERLFAFKHPTLELAMLCAREEFEPPVARLLSETGRLSRTPVFVVGVYSGNDKLGEGQGATLEQARLKAAMHALKAWYLYSPGEGAKVPSDVLEMETGGGGGGGEQQGQGQGQQGKNKGWEPAYIDIGELISR
ncbi:54S ribosomal protein L3 mitochondrial [Podospora bellae-mahoneyi]|uniref:Large ribosomal subunit protein mL44 n=1 Tax=Podospora bellae-mahoneyi TaxID=2093777 RepID=A0ABR0FKT7_9PEZI|nr:54S ribosomal protein L3 mitochondrial [Podospora bellae-mahoneyi]